MIRPNTVKIEKTAYYDSYLKDLQNFSLTPIELESFLDTYVIGQKQAKGIICTKICTHFHKIKTYYLNYSKRGQIEFLKNNILLIGPTGVGKTYMIKLISKKLGVPFVKGDATKFSETGYVGGDVEDLIRELYWVSRESISLAQFGIVFLDEIDKIASPVETIGPDISRSGVQRALLKLLEETEVEIRAQQDNIPYMDESSNKKRKKLILNTKFVLFIGSGAFQGLDELIKKRLKRSNMGFLSELDGDPEAYVNYLKFVTPEDLVKYGFEREFVGRFPVIVVCDPLKEEELYQILANPNGHIILNKKRDFKVYGIDLAFTNEALRLIAKEAYQAGTGARALCNILERYLIEFERALPSLGIKFLGVNEELIKNPESYLREMLNFPNRKKWRDVYLEALNHEKERANLWLESMLSERETFEVTPQRFEFMFELYKTHDIELNKAFEELKFLYFQIKNYEKVFSHKTGLNITFTEEAVDVILEQVLKKNWGIFAYCEKIMSRLEYKLKYLKDHWGERNFYITPLALRKPRAYLEELLRDLD